MINNKKFNFGAGPCILPEQVLMRAGEAVKQWDQAGLSILEISHRSPQFEGVMLETENLVRELLAVPADYSVLFLQGGASMQFCMVPMNFLQGNKNGATYLDAGYFGNKAAREAKLFGLVDSITAVEENEKSAIPQDYTIPGHTAYFHCTSNNTIEGTQMQRFPGTNVPVVCDMSSDIFSRRIDVSQFDLIYAGAQKNMGPAGMTLVIAKNSFLDSVSHQVPSMLDYRIYRDHQSMYNTPPVFAIYTAMLNLHWLKGLGGVDRIEMQNREKAALLYDEIERNPLFYGTANVNDRSMMNVTFRMHDQTRESGFLDFAQKHGMVGIKGYRTVGGFRASLYNALPLESVSALVNCMRTYENTSHKQLITSEIYQ